MIYGDGTRLETPAVDSVVVECSSSPEDAPFNFSLVAAAKLIMRAHCFQVWCRSSSKALPPYNDGFLRLVVDIFDHQGFQVGTGYWDRPLPEELRQCTAIVICRRAEPFYDGDSITYFLLTFSVFEDNIVLAQRLGVGQTVDRFQGVVFEGFRFEGHEMSEVNLF
jgi:hypothetical protein